MTRFTVSEITAYGRKTFKVVDRHESNHELGRGDFVVARTDTPHTAFLIASLLEEFAKSHPNPYAEA